MNDIQEVRGDRLTREQRAKRWALAQSPGTPILIGQRNEEPPAKEDENELPVTWEENLGCSFTCVNPFSSHYSVMSRYDTNFLSVIQLRNKWWSQDWHLAMWLQAHTQISIPPLHLHHYMVTGPAPFTSLCKAQGLEGGGSWGVEACCKNMPWLKVNQPRRTWCIW